MTDKTEVYVPQDYAEAMSQVITQRLIGGPSSSDRKDLRSLQMKLSRVANSRSGGQLELSDNEMSWFNHMQRNIAMAHAADEEFGDVEFPWMPTNDETYWGKRRLKSPESGQRWRPEDRVMELMD